MVPAPITAQAYNVQAAAPPSAGEAPAMDLKARNALQSKREAFHAELPEHNLRGLWHNEMRPLTGLPDTECIPHLWAWKEQREIILRSQQVTTTSEAERRAMIMVNPGVGRCPFTTDTLLAAWQLLLPGEKALCHRHTIFALRFLIEGEGGYTAVGGKKMYMEKGDLILTTQYDWHDHGNEGDQPLIWLDGLDMPMFAGSFPVNFQTRMMDHPDFKGQRYHESSVTKDSPIHFRWSTMKANLAKDASAPYTRLEYINPAFQDGHVSRTVAAYAERLLPGKSSVVRQETANNIYHVVEGSGETIITRTGDAAGPTILKWSQGDTFCVPSWYRFEHVAAESTDEAAYLFNYNDSSALEKLGFMRTADDL